MPCGSRALLFPGQGAHEPDMLAGFADAPTLAERGATVVAALGDDALARIEGGDLEYLNRNVVSSLMTVLASRLALDLYQAGAEEQAPAACAGYSVGQWTALHAAGTLGFTDLVAVVRRRAALMDACVEQNPGGMIAVIGLRYSDVEDVCSELGDRGLAASVANYNCVGQCSVAGEPPALDLALEALAARKPKKLLRLPVAGPWHSELIREAAVPFRAFLDDVDLRPPRVPVIDNVTGGYLPDDPAALRQQLARQLHQPVRWDAGVRHLIAAGCGELVEIGHGNTLTKFGFFIDRSVRHRAFRADHDA